MQKWFSHEYANVNRGSRYGSLVLSFENQDYWSDCDTIKTRMRSDKIN